MDGADDESEGDPAAETPAEQKPDEHDARQAPDRKVRQSVINQDPGALRRVVKEDPRVVKEDPRVAQALQIFEGTVIDMHVM